MLLKGKLRQIFGFSGSAKETRLRDAKVPDGQRIYAVGDIHGRLDLLTKLWDQIQEDAAGQPAGLSNTLIFLGDYVDRGLDSKGVIDFLINQAAPGFDVIHLMGNHEEIFLRFLQKASYGAGWFRIGGDATLLSYGVAIPQHLPPEHRYRAVWRDLHQEIPRAHIEFLTRLKLIHHAGDYVFVHAGLKPEVPIKDQKAQDILWIRDEFLSWQKDHEKVVVHGHSLSGQPDLGYARIGIDTGAYATNNLTCLVLEANRRRFLSTGPEYSDLVL